MKLALFALGVMMTAPLSAATVAQMRGERRVLVVTASRADDPALLRQRRTLADWQRAGADRDVSVVEVIGAHVTGASDAPAALRHARRLPADRFTVILIGKDGHEALRSAEPLSADRLTGTIDAMPMRRAGQR